MLPLRQILFPVDFSAPCRAMAPAVTTLASHYNCPITLLHAFELPVAFYGDLGPLDMVIPSDSARAHESQLRQFAAEVMPGVPHEQIVVQGEPSEAIREYVQRNGADLVMMPTSGRGPLRRLLLGSVVAKVLHDVSCPVWTGAHELEAEGQTHWPIKSILCAVSLEEESVAVAKAAAALAASFGASLTLYHASAFPKPVIDIDYEHYRKQMMDDATQKLQSLRWDNQIEASVTMVEGSAVQSIRSQAIAAKADLVVVGRGHSQGMVSRLWSDLYDVIREAPCPVLSI
ncbi:MAG: universal stress protein [Acidobacteria bacterium]|nr:universal stress protein [Acidobacteriota bacterium]